MQQPAVAKDQKKKLVTIAHVTPVAPANSPQSVENVMQQLTKETDDHNLAMMLMQWWGGNCFAMKQVQTICFVYLNLYMFYCAKGFQQLNSGTMKGKAKNKSIVGHFYFCNSADVTNIKQVSALPLCAELSSSRTSRSVVDESLRLDRCIASKQTSFC